MNRFVVLKRGIALAVIRFAFVWAALSGFSIQSRAGVIVPGTEQAHINFAADPRLQSVGWVSGFNGSVWGTIGSGVLIDEQWVMLTGHQLDGPYSAYRFSLGSSIFQPNTGRAVADAVYLSGTGGNVFAPDLGLMHLSQPITSVVPAIIYTGDEIVEGMPFAWAGYGELLFYPSGGPGFDGMKRGGENLIDEVGPGTTLGADRFAFDFGSAQGTPNLPLEMGGSPGDSGGGAFGFIDGQWQLIGIVASVSGRRESFAVMPSRNMTWVHQTIGVPEPSAFVLTIVGAAILLAGRLKMRWERLVEKV